GDGTGMGTILYYVPPDGLTVNDVMTGDRTCATTSATFIVSLLEPSGLTITVNYATANGTATAGQDYTAASGTLSFPPGQTSRTRSEERRVGKEGGSGGTPFHYKSADSRATCARHWGI